MANDINDFSRQITNLPVKLKRQLAAAIAQEADKLAGAIKDAAPKRTGALKESVQVRKEGDTFWVTAGGDLTTKEIRKGSGRQYDYAMATEFGTKEENAEPFFFNTVRRVAPELQSDIEKQVNDALNS